MQLAHLPLIKVIHLVSHALLGILKLQLDPAVVQRVLRIHTVLIQEVQVVQGVVLPLVLQLHAQVVRVPILMVPLVVHVRTCHV